MVRRDGQQDSYTPYAERSVGEHHAPEAQGGLDALGESVHLFGRQPRVGDVDLDGVEVVMARDLVVEDRDAYVQRECAARRRTEDRRIELDRPTRAVGQSPSPVPARRITI